MLFNSPHHRHRHRQEYDHRQRGAEQGRQAVGQDDVAEAFVGGMESEAQHDAGEQTAAEGPRADVDEYEWNRQRRRS